MGNLSHEDGDIKSHSYHSQSPKSLSFTWNKEKIDPCQLLEKGNRGNLTDKDEREVCIEDSSLSEGTFLVRNGHA